MLFWSKKYYELSKSINKYNPKGLRICGIDPGFRTFMVIYDTLGNSTFYGKELKRDYLTKQNVQRIHKEIIGFILEEYDVIFYGDIILDDKVLRFNKFKKRLLFEANLKNKNVYLVDESFTTKTCSKCGKFNDIKTLQYYYCPCCNNKIHRDVNAAKNILMKGLIENRI